MSTRPQRVIMLWFSSPNQCKSKRSMYESLFLKSGIISVYADKGVKFGKLLHDWWWSVPSNDAYFEQPMANVLGILHYSIPTASSISREAFYCNVVLMSNLKNGMSILHKISRIARSCDKTPFRIYKRVPVCNRSATFGKWCPQEQ